MALDDVKISNMPVLPAYSVSDILPIVDVSLGTNNQISIQQLIDNFFCGVNCAVVNLSSAQILALFTTPVQLVAAPGAGKVIQVIHGTMSYTYNTLTYTLGVGLTTLITDTATRRQFDFADTLASTFSVINTGSVGAGIASSSQLIANTALMIQQTIQNPTVGNGTAKIYIYYRIITL